MNHATVSRLGIIVNPMSGRDVRRVAARASTTTHNDKQQHVTRLVLGALEQGVDEIYLGNEPFRINERAVENLPEKHKIKILPFKLTHTAQDTAHMANAMWDAGCRVFIVLGGDGTNRIVAKTKPDAIVLPLSTGTNNVFPQLLEASIAGIAAGLIATDKLGYKEHCYRAKQVHVTAKQSHSKTTIQDLALIDAVLLKDDSMGSLLPFTSKNLQSIFLTRAEPASVGISPIGGYLMPSYARDDFGVFMTCGEATEASVRVPISPGLYDSVGISSITKMALGTEISCSGPGILAFDGDRSISLEPTDAATIAVRRDGPWIIEPAPILSAAAAAGILKR
ncbi:MAG: NAD(+)/NADH kinase [Pseudomonadales bacterium]|nr:NAD(+)/NADH kinase [Pseudomonadales bacterium]